MAGAATNITADQQNDATMAAAGVPSTDPNSATAGGIIANAQNSATVAQPYTAPQAINPTQVGVAANQTVSGQMAGLANPNNPYYQSWATAGAQTAAARGFSGNSSIEQSGILDSVMRNAAPIASADAATYNNAATANTNSANNFALSNLSAATQNYATRTSAATSAANNQTALAQSGISAAASKYSADTGAATAAMSAQSNAAVQQAHDANSALIASNGQAQTSYNSYVGAVAQIDQNASMDANAKTAAILTQTQIFNSAIAGLQSSSPKLSNISSPLQTAAVAAVSGVNVSSQINGGWGNYAGGVNYATGGGGE